MGSEQSTQHSLVNKHRRTDLARPIQRGKTVSGASPEGEESDDRNGSISPGPSVCSDSDLPYISYTVNRPIGDSPKLSSKPSGPLQRGKSLGSANSSPVKKRYSGARKCDSGGTKTGSHDIVIVKAAKEPDSQEKDPYLMKLKSIPMFLPIMRGTINLPGMRDPEILERLDPQDLLGLCKRLQNYMSLCSEHVSTNQNQITSRIRDVDFELCHLVTSLGERQKKLSKQAEKLNKVTELSHQLNRCHNQLNKTLELMECLNNGLPITHRLEPFVWTTDGKPCSHCGNTALYESFAKGNCVVGGFPQFMKRVGLKLC